jgi:integrase
VQKCAAPTPTAWSPKELKTIFGAAAKYPTAIKGIPGNLVLLAVLHLAYDTGERGAALMQVAWSDINFETKWVTFRGITRKGGIRAKDNCQRLSRESIKALQAIRQYQEQSGQLRERVFPEMHPTSLYGHIRYLLMSTGLPHGRDCMLHKLRRTHATHLHMLGGDATSSLGHDSDTMTRGYYLDPRYTRGEKLADMNEGVFRRMVRRLRVACGL